LLSILTFSLCYHVYKNLTLRHLLFCPSASLVSMFPPLSKIFVGDLIYLRCDPSGSTVKWYIKEDKSSGNKIFKIALASRSDSGDYYCEDNGQKSDNLTIDVLEYVPSASLTIKTGQPVMQPGASIILQLQADESLYGWKCYVYRGGDKVKKIVLRLKNNQTNTHLFEPRPLNVTETIFWCNNTQNQRSNQVTVRISENQVALEAYSLPAVKGEALTLKCLAWGTDQIREAVFYENDKVLQTGSSNTYKIPNMAVSNKARYKCRATFVYPGYTAGPPDKVESEDQDIYVHGIHTPLTLFAVLSGERYLQCSCEQCSSDPFCRYQYYRKVGQEWGPTESSEYSITPEESGTYACRAVWKNWRSSLNKPQDTSTLLVLFLVVAACLVVIIILAFAYFRYKRRNATGG
uniref:Ig-like domain-containing protein n=1 Tax=Mastacembelus armatus TaxID=205130 RepID=A0A3Q3LWM9_9TELE